MLISHRERLQQAPHLKSMANWPAVSIEGLPQKDRPRFRANMRALQMALDGFLYSEIQRQTGIHPTQITRMLKRSLAGDDEEQPALTAALIPRRQMVATKRISQLPTIANPCGAKAAFTYLLDTVPGLLEYLDRILLASLNNKREAENLTPKSFHQHFLLYLEKSDHPANLYPYTEDCLGYQSARKYMHRRSDELMMEALEKQIPKRVIIPRESAFEAGREVQLDEQTYDAKSSIWLKFEDELTPLRLARFSVILVTDTDTTVALGFGVALTQHCSQYDVLDTLSSVSLHTKPTTLATPGIYVPPGPCFPNQINEECAGLAFEHVALDNALAHTAASVESFVTNRHHGTLSLGIPKTPTTRQVVERAFALLSRNAKRHQSTTGSHPNDPVREPRSQQNKAPIVTIFELEEAIYAVLADHNVKPKAYLSGISPLEAYEESVSRRLTRQLQNDHVLRNSAFELSKRVPVKWLKSEHRQPHINFYGCRYAGEGLNKYHVKEVIAYFDYRDIRQLQLTTLDGSKLGVVRAPKSWQKYRHGVKTRQYIMRYCRLKKIRMRDPLVEYFWIQIKRRNREKSALEVYRLYKEYHHSSVSKFVNADFVSSNVTSGSISAHDTDHSDNFSKVSSPSDEREFEPWSTSFAYSYRSRSEDE